MNGPTPTTAAAPTLDPCAMLDGIEARLAHLADLITKQDQDTTEEATDTDTGHQADHQGGGEGCRPTASMT